MYSDNIKRLEEYADRYLELWDFYGAVRIIQRGDVLYEKSRGFACLEHNIKNSMDSRFSLASLSKQFTAFATMILYDMQFLDIDKPAFLYLPEELKINENITVHNLLSHTSGLYNFYSFEDDFFGEKNRLTYSKIGFFNEYISKLPQQTPSEKYEYNNSNYNLLAWIIEHTSGMNYFDFLNKYIFSPLGMNNTEAVDNRIIAGKSFNYLKDYYEYISAPYHNGKFDIGAGSIVSNCDDLYKWYICLKDRKIISKKSYSRFFSTNLNDYCYGLNCTDAYGTKIFSHGGDDLGVSTFIRCVFDEDLCIIILSNNESINQYRFGDVITDILHGVNVDAPIKHKEIALSINVLSKYCGTYLDKKIKIELINNKLYFTRFNDSLHIEIYPIDKDKFVRRYFDQINPYNIEFVDNKPRFFGYTKNIDA